MRTTLHNREKTRKTLTLRKMIMMTRWMAARLARARGRRRRRKTSARRKMMEVKLARGKTRMRKKSRTFGSRRRRRGARLGKGELARLTR